MTTAATRQPSPIRSAGAPSGPLEWIVGTVVFLFEIALVVATGAAAFRAAGGGMLGGFAATAAAIVTVAIWATWMAPRAGRRLRLAGWGWARC